MEGRQRGTGASSGSGLGAVSQFTSVIGGELEKSSGRWAGKEK